MGKLIKLICVKDTKSYDTTIEKGDIVYSNQYYEPYIENNIAIFISSQETTIVLGYYKAIDFLPLDKFREQQIDKILNDD